MRGHEKYQMIPIIVLTTRGDESSQGAAIAAGASHYLTKPFDPGKLAEQVNNLLNNREM